MLKTFQTLVKLKKGIREKRGEDLQVAPTARIKVKLHKRAPCVPKKEVEAVVA